MYLRDVWGVCVRRWYLVVAALLLTVAGAVGVALVVPTTYEAKAYVVLVPPKVPDDPNANRFLGLGGLDGTVAILERSMRSADTAEGLQRAAEDAEYEVIEDYTTSAPILLVTANAPTEVSSSRMLEALLQSIPTKLRRLQSDVDIRPANQITTSVVSQDREPQANIKPRVRAVAGVAVLMLASLSLLIAMTDGLLLRRSRAAAQAAAPPQAPPRPATPPKRKPRRPGPTGRSTGDRIGA